eukprot:sb/3475621/
MTQLHPAASNARRTIVWNMQNSIVLWLPLNTTLSSHLGKYYRSHRRYSGPMVHSKHVNNYLEAVCTTCNGLCCLVCAITDHKGHNVKEIGDTMKTIKDRVRRELVVGSTKTLISPETTHYFALK